MKTNNSGKGIHILLRMHSLILALGLVVLSSRCIPQRPPEKPTQTSNDPTAGSNVAQEIMAAQIPLIAAADQISSLDSAENNLGGIRLQVESSTLDLWWKGEVPDDVRAEIDRQQREQNIHIELLSSKYSQKELNEAAQSVLVQRDEYPGLSYIGPLVDGSGLSVGLTNLTGSEAFKFPLDTKVVQAPMIVQTSRADDTAPYYAGGVTRPVGGTGTCSTGFAVVQKIGLIETSRGILTANHCAPGGGVVFNDGAGDFLGVALPKPTGTSIVTDSLYILTGYNRSAAWTFDGGVAGVDEFAKPVRGLSSVFPGMFVCTSGAGSGVHCNIMVNSIKNSVFVMPSGVFSQGVAFATEVSGGVAVALGDSGGPVFRLDADPSRVWAAGMMIGGTAPTTCVIAGVTSCFNLVAFVDLSDILAIHNVLLLY